ncbi:hypothetical protein VTN00DRAFT_2881 [Thermoascus crustaceus]|uniref:uncharacterized protein n=1 Tax=Thermoascus crustaceus TaxID=5088 RepID=UPI003741F759
MAQPAQFGSGFPQATWQPGEWTTWTVPGAPIASNPAVDGPARGEFVNASRSSTENYSNISPHLHQLLLRASAQLQAQQRSEYSAVSTTFGGPVSSVSPQISPERALPRVNPHQGVSDCQFEPACLSQGLDSSNQTLTQNGLAGARITQPRPYPREHGRGGLVTRQTISPIGTPAVQRLSVTPAGAGYSYAYAPRTQFGDQQSDPRRKVQLQINYLDSLAVGIPTLESLTPELKPKEALRARLTEIAREAITSCAKSRGLSAGPDCIDFKCFGSLRNGFGLPGADLDLAMTTRASSFPRELQDECPRILEKAFLDAGFGARLIENARVPVIKLCEKPSEELLEALRAERKAWETKKARVNPDSGHVDDGTRQHRGDLEFPKSGFGIQCDITFSSRLAIYNSELLRCYSLCDERVRIVGVFVKKWAKARKINSPYHGTMCSYGYILMVIHYLTNIVTPPLIPNLQINYRPPPPGQKEVTTVDGYDVRFFNDEAEIKARAKVNPILGNRQSVGDLLRGFFAYYGSQGRNAPHGGFNWARDVISIRTRGGILSKAEKGWTAAKVDQKGNRHRFLVAIEDPFELDHNVARTVPYHGLLAIKDEFRRAHTIINRIQEIPGAGWQWRTDEGDIGEDFFAEAVDRLNLQLSGRGHERSTQTHTRSPPYPGGSRWPSTSARQPSAAKEDITTQVPSGSNHTYRKGVHPADSILIPLSQQAARAKEASTKQQSGQIDIPKQNNTASDGEPYVDESQLPLSTQGANETSDSASGRTPSRAGSHSTLTSGPLHAQDRVEGVDAQVPAANANEQNSVHEVGIARYVPGHRAPRSSRFARAPVSSTVRHPPTEEKRVSQVNPLIHPPKSQAMQKQEARKQRFDRSVATAANSLHRILDGPEPNNVSDTTAFCTPADPAASAAREGNSVPVGQDFKNIGGNKMTPRTIDNIASHARKASKNSHNSKVLDMQVPSEMAAVKTPGMTNCSPDSEAILARHQDSDSIAFSGNTVPISDHSPLPSGSLMTMNCASHSELSSRDALFVPRRRGLVVDPQQLHHGTHAVSSNSLKPAISESKDFYNNHLTCEDRSIGRTSYPESEFSTPDIERLGVLPFHEASIS